MYVPQMSPYESNVKQHRERVGLSQEALARQLGVSRQTIVSIERGLSEPRVLLALAIAAALGVAVQELFRKGMIL
jgi:DNA-binding XRE family transcriptional regulator